MRMLAAWNPEQPWRMGPGVSPSRARRAAVIASAGAPSVPQRSSAWVTLARRKMACSVRTCLSSPVCEELMMASSVGVQAQVVRGTRIR